MKLLLLFIKLLLFSYQDFDIGESFAVTATKQKSVYLILLLYHNNNILGFKLTRGNKPTTKLFVLIQRSNF